jgi:hypothetical protein
MCIMYMMPGPSSDGEFNTGQRLFMGSRLAWPKAIKQQGMSMSRMH